MLESQDRCPMFDVCVDGECQEGFYCNKKNPLDPRNEDPMFCPCCNHCLPGFVIFLSIVENVQSLAINHLNTKRIIIIIDYFQKIFIDERKRVCPHKERCPWPEMHCPDGYYCWKAKDLCHMHCKPSNYCAFILNIIKFAIFTMYHLN